MSKVRNVLWADCRGPPGRTTVVIVALSSPKRVVEMKNMDLVEHSISYPIILITPCINYTIVKVLCIYADVVLELPDFGQIPATPNSVPVTSLRMSSDNSIHFV